MLLLTTLLNVENNICGENSWWARVIFFDYENRLIQKCLTSKDMHTYTEALNFME